MKETEKEKAYTTEGGLPENAFRELEKGEQYTPVMHPERAQEEVTP